MVDSDRKSRLQGLLNSGAITQSEFDSLVANDPERPADTPEARTSRLGGSSSRVNNPTRARTPMRSPLEIFATKDVNKESDQSGASEAHTRAVDRAVSDISVTRLEQSEDGDAIVDTPAKSFPSSVGSLKPPSRPPRSGSSEFLGAQRWPLEALSVTPLKIGTAAALLVGIILLDAVFGPLFPDDIYCAVGAGTAYQQPASVSPGGWAVGNGCYAGNPACVTSWVVRSASKYCMHGTFWDAIMSAAR